MQRLLMHVGPSIGNDDILKAGARGNIGFASPEFIEAMKDSLEGTRYVMGADRSYQPFILPGSGTSAMESVLSFLHAGDRVLIITNGVFGDRWEGIFSRYSVKHDVLRAHAGSSVTPGEVAAKVESAHYRMAVMTHVETSTGVRLPLDHILEVLRNRVDITVLDSIAGAGGEIVDAKRRGIDIAITASQKAIGAPPGAGLLVASENAMSHLSDDSLAGYSLNLENWLPIMKGMEGLRGGYFATPPINTVLSMQKAFSLIMDETMQERARRHSACAGMLHAGLDAMGAGQVAEKDLRSSTVTGVLLKNATPGDVLKKSAALGVEFGSGPHPGVKPGYIRIGHMGWVQEHHILRALSVLERSLNASGEKITRGRALAAAQEVLTGR